MTEIYLHIVARMADYMDTHPYSLTPLVAVSTATVMGGSVPGVVGSPKEEPSSPRAKAKRSQRQADVCDLAVMTREVYLRITGSTVRVRADIIGHARINVYVNLSHAWFKMAD